AATKALRRRPRPSPTRGVAEPTTYSAASTCVTTSTAAWAFKSKQRCITAARISISFRSACATNSERFGSTQPEAVPHRVDPALHRFVHGDRLAPPARGLRRPLVGRVYTHL